MSSMRFVLLTLIIFSGCAWKPKPYLRDPMGKLPLQWAEPASVEPLSPAWPVPPEPVSGLSG